MQKRVFYRIKVALIYITKLMTYSLPIDRTNTQQTEKDPKKEILLNCFISHCARINIFASAFVILYSQVQAH